MRSVVAAPPEAVELHGFLEWYERDYPDEVVHIERPVDVEWELTALATRLEREKRFPILICHRLVANGRELELPVVSFMMASRLRLARAFGVGVREAGIACYRRLQHRVPPVVVSREEAPVKQIVATGGAVDVRELPALRHHRMDPGRYVTQGLFLTFNRQTRRDNSAMQRGWLADRDEIRVFLGPSTHNAKNLREYEEAGEDMPAAYWVGHHPLALLGAATRVGVEESHYEAAGGTLGSPLRLVPSETLGQDFLVPADAEIVIEGYMPRGQRKPEGPFGEYTRYVGPQRWCPFLKVTAITRRRDAYWDDVMVGHTHWISSLGKEGEIHRAVQQAVPTVRAVHVPMSGAGVQHVYVQIRKTIEGQGKVAALAALNAYFANKHAFVFDEDVDIFDEKEVLLALATRFQADRGLVVVNGITGSPLDPSSEDGFTTCKVGFDCTKPLGKPFAERLSIPQDVMDRIDPFEIIGQDRLERIPVEPWG
ncbi:MAG TPA: UbiD family decarboxylase [Chloroflexota bacterium]|nr:UbiD family decarboxylase [Chloroflexota bacterium]